MTIISSYNFSSPLQLESPAVLAERMRPSKITLHGRREAGRAVPDGGSHISRPSDELLEEVVDLLDETSWGLKGLAKCAKRKRRFK